MISEQNREANDFEWDKTEAEAAATEQTVDAEAGASEDAGRRAAEEERSGADAAGGEADELRDRYLRLAAEYDNYRKRTDRERMETRDRSQAQLVERLLEPLDDLQRVAQYPAETTTTDSLLEGVRMVERKLLRALEAAGLEPLDAHGKPFDPAVHEALMTTATEDEAEDDTVGEVFQPGYLFRGVLIRPARVQVRKHGD